MSSETRSPAGHRTPVTDSRLHLPEYLMEGALLGAFMLSACGCTALLFHPASPLAGAGGALGTRLLMGLAMGATAVALVYSPWGQRSGAHMNPSFTLTFLRLGKIAPVDAAGYVAGHFAGAVAGVLAARALFGAAVAHPAVEFAVTVPGAAGVPVAFVAEVAISFVLMAVVLTFSNSARLSGVTGVAAGVLIAAYVALEAPLSGMSMNPARTTGSAAVAGVWTALWIYFTAPPLGMLLAAEVYRRVRGAHRVYCAKLHHRNAYRCIFRCNYGALA